MRFKMALHANGRSSKGGATSVRAGVPLTRLAAAHTTLATPLPPAPSTRNWHSGSTYSYPDAADEGRRQGVRVGLGLRLTHTAFNSDPAAQMCGSL